MKKTFTFFAISALFLMLLFPVSVKAEDPVLTFLFEQSAHDNSASDDNCSGGTVTGWDAIISSDFHFSGPLYDAVKQYQYINESWTCIKAGAKVCTRNDVHLTAGTYTFVLKTTWAWGKTGTKVPTIKVDGNTYSHDDVDYVNNQIVNLQYTGIYISTTGDYPIEITLVDGDNDKYGFQTLTIVSATPPAPTYEVSATASNGSVSGTGSFEEGAEVTLTASPNENYSFTGWSSSDISIADASANPLVFTMPANAVSVTANFAACTKHTVTLTAGDNGSVSGGGEQCDGSVTVIATPNSGYRFVNWTNTSSEVVSTNAEYTFTLSTDISLTANFAVEICSNTMVLQCEDYVSYNTKPSGSNDNKPGNLKSKDYTGYGNPIGGYYADFDNSTGEMWIPVTLPAGTFTFTVRYVKGGNNMWFNLYDVSNNSKIDNSKQLSQKGDSWDSDVSNSYTLTSGDYVIGIYGNDSYTGLDQITITASSNVFCPNTITMQKIGDASADDPTSSPANTAMAGVEVTITAGEASANHYFSGWTVSPENAVTFDDPASPTTTFVMPEADVTITANYGAVVSSEFTYTTSGSGSINCATESGSSVESGTPISMTAVPSTDYVFTGWTATAGSFSSESALTTTFTMPATAAEVTANFAQVDNKIITGTSETVIESNGTATLTVTSVSDFDAFNHNVLKFAYSDMDGKYKGQKVAVDAGYNYASSAGATGFGFYYKTEKADDNVAFCFEVSSGQQVKWELQATNNVWKYYYFAHPEAAGWDHSGIFIYMNGDDGGNHTTYKDAGAFYMSEIAATSITSKPDIDTYQYTNNRGGAMQVNEYGTLCLPMAGTISGATLYSVAGKETGDINYLVLDEEEGNTIVAGKPYITQSTATFYTVTMSGAHSAVQAGNGLVGTYTEINPLTPYDDTHHNYFLYENAFKKAGTGVTVGAYRAYLNWDAVSAAPAQAPSARRIRMVIEGKEAQTGMETVTAMPKTTKVLIDGQLFIIREGKRYTLTGARAQ